MMLQITLMLWGRQWRAVCSNCPSGTSPIHSPVLNSPPFQSKSMCHHIIAEFGCRHWCVSAIKYHSHCPGLGWPGQGFYTSKHGAGIESKQGVILQHGLHLNYPSLYLSCILLMEYLSLPNKFLAHHYQSSPPTLTT